MSTPRRCAHRERGLSASPDDSRLRLQREFPARADRRRGGNLEFVGGRPKKKRSSPFTVGRSELSADAIVAAESHTQVTARMAGVVRNGRPIAGCTRASSRLPGAQPSAGSPSALCVSFSSKKNLWFRASYERVSRASTDEIYPVGIACVPRHVTVCELAGEHVRARETSSVAPWRLHRGVLIEYGLPAGR